MNQKVFREIRRFEASIHFGALSKLDFDCIPLSQEQSAEKLSILNRCQNIFFERFVCLGYTDRELYI